MPGNLAYTLIMLHRREDLSKWMGEALGICLVIGFAILVPLKDPKKSMDFAVQNLNIQIKGWVSGTLPGCHREQHSFFRHCYHPRRGNLHPNVYKHTSAGKKNMST